MTQTQYLPTDERSSHGSTEPAADGGVALRGVVKRYGTATAVAGVDLDVHAGEFLSLLGPSGCGKTTLLRMLAGFEQPDEGHISIGGSSMIGVPPNKRPVNTVFQSYALFPHMSVAENVAYGLRQRRTPKAEIGKRVGEALAMVQMGKFADRSPKNLSGGQQQRIALARALVNRPSVLLLDEPMSALDRKLREEMQVELKLLQRQLGITFVFVTHDQEEALSMSDRIVVMRDGIIEQTGSGQGIYAKPTSAFVAGFIGKQNFMSATVRGPGVLDAADCTLRSTHSTGVSGSKVLAAVRAECVNVLAARPAAAENSVSGALAGVSFLGDVMQYVVRTASGQELLCRMPPSNAPKVTPGETVWCSWDTADVQVFADPAGGC